MSLYEQAAAAQLTPRARRAFEIVNQRPFPDEPTLVELEQTVRAVQRLAMLRRRCAGRSGAA